ncbi:MAG: zinc metalloprotease [marine bacterium B5-7]|nr:MAG: zinc metalloprotease [marine bacterium B5-7]
MDFLFSIFGFVLAIGILVTVHEYGHFWVARTLGVKVLRFSIGFGRPLFTWRGRRDDTEYVVAMIPLGGYVKMLDEHEGDVADEDIPRAFNRKSLGVRSAVVLAGPAFNFLFAIAAYWLINTVGIDGVKPVIGEIIPGSVASEAGLQVGDTIVEIDGRKTQTWGEHRLYIMSRLVDGKGLDIIVSRDGTSLTEASLRPQGDASDALSPAGIEQMLGMRPALPELESVVGSVADKSPAAAAGLQTGDRIVAIDGRELSSWRELVERVMPNPGQTLNVEIDRKGQRIVQNITPEAVVVGDDTIGRIGISPAPVADAADYFTTVDLGFAESLKRAVEQTWLMSSLTLKMLYRMLKLEISTENLSGPITIAHYAGQSVQIGLIPFLTFLAIISVSLGVLNLLPIPVLDGGHLLYYLIELIRGGPVPERVMYWGQQVGIVMLACLMGLAFYNDVLRLLS